MAPRLSAQVSFGDWDVKETLNKMPFWAESLESIARIVIHWAWPSAGGKKSQYAGEVSSCATGIQREILVTGMLCQGICFASLIFLGKKTRYAMSILSNASAFNTSDTRCCQQQHTTPSYINQFISIQHKWYKMFPIATHYAILY